MSISGRSVCGCPEGADQIGHGAEIKEKNKKPQLFCWRSGPGGRESVGKGLPWREAGRTVTIWANWQSREGQGENGEGHTHTHSHTQVSGSQGLC